MTDCLLIGPNDMVFEEYVKTLKSMGVDSRNSTWLSSNWMESPTTVWGS